MCHKTVEKGTHALIYGLNDFSGTGHAYPPGPWGPHRGPLSAEHGHARRADGRGGIRRHPGGY